MATETLTLDPIQKTFVDLETEKTLITTCTNLCKNLNDHFSSLSQTLTSLSQTLDSKIQTLDSETHQTLETLNVREASIPDREVSAAATVEEKKNSVLREAEDPEFKNPDDITGLLHYCSRRMDSRGLWRFMISRRKDLSLIRREIPNAIAAVIAPCWLVLDAVEDFLNRPVGAVGADWCWTGGMLIRALFDFEGRKGLEVSWKMRERAMRVEEAWKERMKGEGERGEMGGAESQIFLQLVVAFGLREV